MRFGRNNFWTTDQRGCTGIYKGPVGVLIVFDVTFLPVNAATMNCEALSCHTVPSLLYET